LYPISPEDKLGEGALRDVTELIKTMRGEDGTLPFTDEELSEIEWQGQWYDDQEVVKQIFRTVYFCLNQNKTDLAMNLRFCLDPIAMQKVVGLPTETRELVYSVYNVLCLYFFYNIPDGVAYYLFESGFVVLALKLGFKLEDIIADVTNRMVAFDRRKVFCIELSASLGENMTTLGADNNHEEKNIKYWVDNFRIYSQGNFGGPDLLNFAADKNYFGGCSGDDRELIVKVLQLYTHLINGYLAVPNGDLAAVDKRLKDLESAGKADDPLAYFEDYLLSSDAPVVNQNFGSSELSTEEKEILNIPNDTNDTNETNKKIDVLVVKKLIMSEFGYAEGGQFEDVGAVINRLQELAADFNDPEIADLYYFDEQSGEFKWRE